MLFEVKNLEGTWSQHRIGLTEKGLVGSIRYEENMFIHSCLPCAFCCHSLLKYLPLHDIFQLLISRVVIISSNCLRWTARSYFCVLIVDGDDLSLLPTCSLNISIHKFFYRMRFIHAECYHHTPYLCYGAYMYRWI